MQILEYFPDKLTVNQLSAEQLRFVKSALASTTKSIDDFLLLMPEDDVTAAKRQVDDENRLNKEEYAEFVKEEYLNPPTIS